MKFIHTSDWHLGQNFYRFSRDDEHKHFIEQLCTILHNVRPDALLISGDIYDTAAPSSSTQKLFVESILKLRDASKDTQIIITAGNHDSGLRLEISKQLWHLHGVTVVGSAIRNDNDEYDFNQFIVSITDNQQDTLAYILAIPYFHPSNFPCFNGGTPREERQKDFFITLLAETEKMNLNNKPVVMMAHLAVTGCDLSGHEDNLVGGMQHENLDQLGDSYDYLALGHIHKSQTLNHSHLCARYSGSPIPLSFTENYTHSVSLVEIDTHGDSPIIKTIDIEPLRSMKSITIKDGSFDEALVALQNIDNNDLSYVRIVMDNNELIPIDAETRANEITTQKRCLLCEIRKITKLNSQNDATTSIVENPEDLKRIPPIEIAQLFYEKNNDAKMPDNLVTLMNEAIAAVENDNRLN